MSIIKPTRALTRERSHVILSSSVRTVASRLSVLVLLQTTMWMTVTTCGKDDCYNKVLHDISMSPFNLYITVVVYAIVCCIMRLKPEVIMNNMRVLCPSLLLRLAINCAVGVRFFVLSAVDYATLKVIFRITKPCICLFILQSHKDMQALWSHVHVIVTWYC